MPTQTTMTMSTLHTTPSRALFSLVAVVAATLLGACAAPVDLNKPAPAAAAAPAKLPPATPATTKSVLWLGNSFFYFNNSLHDQVRNMLLVARPGQTGYRANSVTISAAGINWHDVESHFKPGSGMGSYTFNAKNEVVPSKYDRLYDVGLMMDCSQCPIHPQMSATFFEYAAKHSATLRRYGTEPAFFMSWAYADQPEMTKQLADAYDKAGADNQALVVPAGLAFAKSMAMRPDLNLYAADKRHPSMMGSYLSSATVLATLYGQNPIGNTYTAGLPADVALHLQTVAWETVQARMKK